VGSNPTATANVMSQDIGNPRTLRVRGFRHVRGTVLLTKRRDSVIHDPASGVLPGVAVGIHSLASAQPLSLAVLMRL